MTELRQQLVGTREPYILDERPWEQRRERFAAQITLNPSPVLHHAPLDSWDVEFSVQNLGLRTWLCETDAMPIRLGARLLDGHGQVLREQRAEPFQGDVQPGDIRQGKIRLEFSGLHSLVAMVELNLVYELRFWFDATAVMLQPPWLAREAEE
jgi:hypothetical protein